MARRRRGWKKGDWLVRDEDSDYVVFGSKTGRDYYGTLKVRKEFDPVHPQDFVRAKRDPFIPYPQNPPALTYDLYTYDLGNFIGDTDVPAPDGPATHLYGIGFMEIVNGEGATEGTPFVVR